MSRELFAAHEAGKVRAAGRASGFFGPRVTDSAAGETIFGRAVAGKVAQVAGAPALPHTYTYTPDVGKGPVTLGEREEALSRAWHLPSLQTVSTRRFVEMLYEFEELFVVDHSNFKHAFGEHATSLKEAIADTVRWYCRERPAGGIHPAA